MNSAALSDTGYAPRDWVSVQRLVWEAAHGPIPPGHRIAFKGGKPVTDEALIVPEALECITPPRPCAATADTTCPSRCRT